MRRRYAGVAGEWDADKITSGAGLVSAYIQIRARHKPATQGNLHNTGRPRCWSVVGKPLNQTPPRRQLHSINPDQHVRSRREEKCKPIANNQRAYDLVHSTASHDALQSAVNPKGSRSAVGGRFALNCLPPPAYCVLPKATPETPTLSQTTPVSRPPAAPRRHPRRSR
jgi:hypothetical protein